MTRFLLLLVVALAGCERASVAQAPQPIVPVAPVSAESKTTLIKVPYIDDIRDAAELYFGIPAPVALILGQVAQESAFDPKAKSPVGAQGLMQLMPTTGTWIAAQAGFGVAAPLDPKWNLRAGIWYDKFLYDRMIYSSPCHKWGAALSGFNGGAGWHNKRQARAADPNDFWNSVRTVNPGITPANQIENQSYSYKIVYVQQPKFAAIGKKICL